MSEAPRTRSGTATPQLGGAEIQLTRHLARLSKQAKSQLLAEYEQRYGRPARIYAQRMLAPWHDGQIRMSREIAYRLFGLVPGRLPSDARWSLVEGLLQAHGHSSHYELTLPTSISWAELSQALQTHFAEMRSAHPLPDTLGEAFAWLSDQDVRAFQALKQHLLEAEYDALLPTLLRQVELLWSATQHHGASLRHTAELGPHRVTIVLDERATGMHWQQIVSDGRNSSASNTARINPAPSLMLAGFAGGAAVAIALIWLLGDL